MSVGSVIIQNPGCVSTPILTLSGYKVEQITWISHGSFGIREKELYFGLGGVFAFGFVRLFLVGCFIVCLF